MSTIDRKRLRQIIESQRPTDLPEGQKWCSKCKTVKAIDAFSLNRRMKDGRSHWCRACQSVAEKEYAQRRSG